MRITYNKGLVLNCGEKKKTFFVFFKPLPGDRASTQGKMKQEPFWEQAYRDGREDPFGSASPEILELAYSLKPGSHVIDLGCGAGRNALALARAGMVVTAVDVSHAACERLKIAAHDLAVLQVIEQDLRSFDFALHYDLVIAHGVLHLLPRLDRIEVLERIKLNTVPGGINVIAVFTNQLPTPPDLAEVTLGLFDEGELFDAYRDWEIVLARSHTLHDEHPGGICHEHSVNKIIARRPK
jgi:tellurite methyltransferase